MELLAECLVLSIILTFVASSPAFDFSKKPPPNGYCARLECSASIIQNGNQDFFIYELVVYDVTQTNSSKVKLASVSVLDPGLYLDPTKAIVINASGTVTKSSGNLTLDLLDKTDCHERSFLCELDFVNENGQTDVLKKFVLPDGEHNNGQLTDILGILNEMKSLIGVESAKTYEILAALQSDNVILKTASFNLGSDAALIKTEVSRLGNDNVFFKTEVSNLGNGTEFLKNEVSNLGKDNALLKTEVSYLRNQSAVIQRTLEALVQRLEVTHSPNNPAYTTTIKPINTPATNFQCLRGAPASSSRIPFMLWGQIPAICDTETDGGGWIIIQRRTKGDVDFYRPWVDYKEGFGNIRTDFWIGNDVIHELTAHGYTTAWINMMYSDRYYYAQYSNFYVGNEKSMYQLTFSGYSGTAGDSLDFHNGGYFSTWDRNNNPGTKDCVGMYRGGWWYKQCYHANLNGLFNTPDIRGAAWEGIAMSTSVSSVEIKLRHV